MRIAVLFIAVGVAAVCWMAVSLIFGGRYYYFTEHTTDDRINGFVDRLNSESIYQSDDGAVNLGYFLLDRRIENRIKMPSDWDGDFGVVEFPPGVSDVSNDFLELVQRSVCGASQTIEDYVEDDVLFEVVFMDALEQPVEHIRGDSPACY